jgi:hypothetical protein
MVTQSSAFSNQPSCLNIAFHPSMFGSGRYPRESAALRHVSLHISVLRFTIVDRLNLVKTVLVLPLPPSKNSDRRRVVRARGLLRLRCQCLAL